MNDARTLIAKLQETLDQHKCRQAADYFDALEQHGLDHAASFAPKKSKR